MAENGNIATMREALRTLRQRFDNDVMAYQDRYLKFSEWHWHKKAAEAARWRDVFYELREVCDTALAEPPRNCDVYRTVDDAFAACHADRGYISDPVAERRSTISFMLSNAQETAKVGQCASDNAQETAKIERPVNNAAMREALVQCELFLGNVSRHAHPTLNPGDKCTACAGVDELRGMVAAAIAAPARNCDWFAKED